MTDRHSFHALTPGFVMDAIESQGFTCDCRVLTLNSYENRVYQVGIEDGPPLIAKFYRPGRWNDAQILEEHRFSLELAEHELPVVAPLANGSGESLFRFGDFRFALYPRKGGHAPELDDLDNLLILGRLLGRMHRIGAVRPFACRPALDVRSFGHESVELIRERFIPPEYRANYEALSDDLLQGVEAVMNEVKPLYLRTHGDFHVGNILWRENAPHLVDFDDSRMAPAVQDLWMMLSGERPGRTPNSRRCWRVTANSSIFTPASCCWWRPCAPCASCISRPGWAGAGKTRPFPGISPGSTPPATGGSTSWSCASRSPPCRNRPSQFSRQPTQKGRPTGRPSSNTPIFSFSAGASAGEG